MEKLTVNLIPPWQHPGGKRPYGRLPVSGKELIDMVVTQTPDALNLAKSEYVLLIPDPDVDCIDEHVMKMPQEKYLILDYIGELNSRIRDLNDRLDIAKLEHRQIHYQGRSGPTIDMIAAMFKADPKYKTLRDDLSKLERVKARAEAIKEALNTKQSLLPGLQGKQNALLRFSE